MSTKHRWPLLHVENVKVVAGYLTRSADLDRLQELNKQIARLLADAEALNNEARLLARRIYGERETE